MKKLIDRHCERTSSDRNGRKAKQSLKRDCFVGLASLGLLAMTKYAGGTRMSRLSVVKKAAILFLAAAMVWQGVAQAGEDALRPVATGERGDSSRLDFENVPSSNLKTSIEEKMSTEEQRLAVVLREIKEAGARLDREFTEVQKHSVAEARRLLNQAAEFEAGLIKQLVEFADLCIQEDEIFNLIKDELILLITKHKYIGGWHFRKSLSVDRKIRGACNTTLIHLHNRKSFARYKWLTGFRNPSQRQTQSCI